MKEYCFSYYVVEHIYEQIRSKSVALDEILLRTLSRLVYFKYKPCNRCTEEEFNELNIYLSMFCRDNQLEMMRVFNLALANRMEIGDFFFKNWQLEIAESFVWAVTTEQDIAVKLYDFGTEVAKKYLLEKSKNYILYKRAAIEKLLLEGDLEKNNHLLLILSAYEIKAEWSLPREVLLHEDLKSFLFYIEDDKGISYLDCGDGDCVYLRRKDMYSPQRTLLTIPLSKVGKERKEDVIRIFQRSDEKPIQILKGDK